MDDGEVNIVDLLTQDIKNSIGIITSKSGEKKHEFITVFAITFPLLRTYPKKVGVLFNPFSIGKFNPLLQTRMPRRGTMCSMQLLRKKIPSIPQGQV